MGADGSTPGDTFPGQDGATAPAQGLEVESSAAEVVDEDVDPGETGQGTTSAAAPPGRDAARRHGARGPLVTAGSGKGAPAIPRGGAPEPRSTSQVTQGVRWSVRGEESGMLRRLALQDSESSAAPHDDVDLRDGADRDGRPSAAAVANPRRTRR